MAFDLAGSERLAGDGTEHEVDGDRVDRIDRIDRIDATAASATAVFAVATGPLALLVAAVRRRWRDRAARPLPRCAGRGG